MTFARMDIVDSVPDKLRAMIGGGADVVMSDMAANTTGHRRTDQSHHRPGGKCSGIRMRNPQSGRHVSGKGVFRAARTRICWRSSSATLPA